MSSTIPEDDLGLIPSFSIPADDSSSRGELEEGLGALRSELSVADKSGLRGFDESAVEIDSNSVHSLEIPTASGPIDRIRRRSELSRIRPTSFAVPEVIELPVLRYAQSTSVATGVAFANDDTSLGKATDLEFAQGASTPVSPEVYISDALVGNPSSIATRDSASQRLRSRIQFAAMCYSFFLEGWNDGTTGPLLPTIQRNYGIGFAIVSLLFVFNCVGFVSGAIMNVWLNDRFGLGKVLVFGAIMQLIGYVLISPAGPFPLMCAGFAFAGYGISLQNAQANGYVGSLKKNARVKFGFLHASYGLGAFVAPLVATHFATSRHWSFHYVISASIAVSNTIVLLMVFRFKKLDKVLAETGQETVENSTIAGNLYRQILGLREVHFLAVFSLIYVGVEVSLGGWIVTFIEQKRGGGASAGYISSGFFGGLMLGRLILMWLNRKIGERRVLFIYALIVIQLEVTVWVVPSLIENAVAVCFIGLLLGPMYPILMNHSTTILPAWLLTGCLGYIGGIGQAGSAVLPFVTGLLASKFGIGALQPLIVSMMSTMIVIWALVPKVRRID